MMRPASGDGDFRPFDGLVFFRGIGLHIAVTLMVFANDEDAGFIGLLTRARRRVDRNHNSRQVWSCGLARGIDDSVAPQRAWGVFEQFGVELLPTESASLRICGYGDMAVALLIGSSQS
jgi:hypothetical protein